MNEILTLKEIEILLSRFPGQLPSLGLLGGEPFVYPYLIEALSLLWKHNVLPKIFTSATPPLPRGLKDVCLSKQPLNFVVNVGTRDTYNKTTYKNLTDFFEKFHTVASLSFTIFDLTSDPVFLFDLIDQFNLSTRNIRVGVALPIYKGNNEFIKKENYRECGEYFLRFARKAHARNITLGMDCGFTACMFTPSEIGALQRNGVRVAFICGAAIDIGPKLKSWNCFPLFQLQSENVLESKTIDELNDKFNKKMDSYFVNQPGIFPECAECKYYKRNQCQGGCKSFKSSNA